jgi:GTP-binding protein
MLPVIAIAGRPNVGKSTLFNVLTRARTALVADEAGLTRDRQYGRGIIGERPYIVVDTGGLSDSKDGVEELMAAQAWLAISEADVVLFMVDARAGLTPQDEELAQKLRVLSKVVYLVVNKIDGLDSETVKNDFYRIGLGEPHTIAASHGRGVTTLINFVLEQLPAAVEAVNEETQKGIKIAFVGRPNVGKSTLVNRMLGEERVIVYDQPGTTRDSIFIPFSRRGTDYVLIDTAGVRRRGKIAEIIEKFSVIKTMQAIEAANVVVLVIDAREGIAEQDLKLLGQVLNSGKAIVVAINKWDNLSTEERGFVRNGLERRLTFIDFAELHFISALHGTGVGTLFAAIDRAYRSATKELATPELTRILQRAVEQHEPPLAQGRRIKLRYAHPGGHNPPIIVIHGTRVTGLPSSYTTYLTHFFIKSLKLVGTPLRIVLRTSKSSKL